MSLIIEGRVKKGKTRGRKLGFPTVNINVPKSVKKKQWGIYLSLVRVGESIYPGLTHLGPPKTFSLSRATCETYLLTLRQNLYNKKIKKRLLLKLREVEEFPSAAYLKKQIQKDIKAAKKFFGL